MIKEVVSIRVDASKAVEFEESVASSITLFEQARGNRGVQLFKSIDIPGNYQIVVFWVTMEDHTEHFRNSEAFQEYRAKVGIFYINAPLVEHFHEVEVRAG